MKQAEAVNQFLAGRRVVIAKFVAHRYKEVQNKAKKVVGIVNLYEVQCADGKAPTVQTWCPRSVQTVEQAATQCPVHSSRTGRKLVIEFDLMEPNTFDAKNGVMIRGGFSAALGVVVTWPRMATPWEKGSGRDAPALAGAPGHCPILVREVCTDSRSKYR